MSVGIRESPVIAFFGLTFLLSWSAWSPLVFSEWWATWSPTVLATDTGTFALIVLGGFGPLLAAAIVTWSVGDSVRAWATQLLRWRVRPRYWLAALFVPAAVILAASGLHIVAFGAAFGPADAETLVLYPLLFVQVFLFGGGNEELGWRGFALPRLQERVGALVASVIIGVAWFAWHLPLFVVSGSSQAGVPVLYYGVAVLALSVVFTWLYNATGGSVLLTTALHASVNTGGILYLAGGGAAMRETLPNALYAAVFVMVALVIVGVYDRERLAHGEMPTGPAGTRRR